MIRLTKKQVLMLHTQLIKETGGSDLGLCQWGGLISRSHGTGGE